MSYYQKIEIIASELEYFAEQCIREHFEEGPRWSMGKGQTELKVVYHNVYHKHFGGVMDSVAVMKVHDLAKNTSILLTSLYDSKIDMRSMINIIIEFIDLQVRNIKLWE